MEGRTHTHIHARARARARTPPSLSLSLTHTHTHTQKEREEGEPRETDRQTATEMERQTETERQRQTDRDRENSWRKWQRVCCVGTLRSMIIKGLCSIQVNTTASGTLHARVALYAWAGGCGNQGRFLHCRLYQCM